MHGVGGARNNYGFRKLVLALPFFCCPGSVVLIGNNSEVKAANTRSIRCRCFVVLLRLSARDIATRNWQKDNHNAVVVLTLSCVCRCRNREQPRRQGFLMGSPTQKREVLNEFVQLYSIFVQLK